MNPAKADFTPPRGMRDITPEEMNKRRYVRQKIESVFSLFGYDFVDPTHIERIETIFAKAGPEIEKEIYAFDDKGGRRLGLRFDLTVGMARMVASNPDWPKPLRIAAISNIWRYDQPQYGRYRSVEQWDVELFGSTQPSADAEIVQLSSRIMEDLDLDQYRIPVNDRNIMDQFLRHLQLEADKAAILRIMDKRGKITRDEMTRMLQELNIDDSQIDLIFDFSSQQGDIYEVCEFLRECGHIQDTNSIQRMEEIGGILEESMGLERIEFDLSLVRGLDYYTGFVFECFDAQDESLGSVFGGGRFDGLVGLYGRPSPAVGCAGGITRLILALENKDLIPESIFNNPQVLVAPVTEKEMPKAMKIASDLRQNGVGAVVDVMSRNLSKNLDHANRMGHPFVIIVGSRDLSKGVVTLRNMKSGEEDQVEIDRVSKAITNEKI